MSGTRGGVEVGAPGVAGLLLSGGASRRMGSDKALIRWGDQRLVDRAADVLAAVCVPVLEVGSGHSGLPAIQEQPPGAGPLAGLAVGGQELDSRGHRGPVLVLAVDMPRVTPALLRMIAVDPTESAVVPIAAGRPQPLCARYPLAARQLAVKLTEGGKLSMQALLDQLDVRWLLPEEWSLAAALDAFADIDTPEDLARLRMGSRLGRDR